MIEPFLKSQLEPVARRRRLWLLARDLAVCWGTAAALAFVFYLVRRSTGWLPSWVLPALAVAAVTGALVVWIRNRRSAPDFHQIARDIEQGHPELHALLLTAVEQRPDAKTGKYNFLQQRLLREAVLESLQAHWLDAVSTRRLIGTQLLQVGAFVVLLAALTGLRTQRQLAVVAGQPTKIQVTPGDATIERGSGLAVLARFDGPLPAEVTLVIRPDSQPERRVPLVKSLNDPVFGGTLPEVTNTLSYHVAYTSGRSRDFKVEVFEYPRLERADAHLVFPAYTGLPERRVEDTRRISAVAGSTLDLSLQLNKPVVSARLVARDKSSVPLTAGANQANASLGAFPLKTSQVYEVVLVDAAGRSNKVPAQLIVDVLTNRGPELKFQSPRGDQRVSPLEEITFQGEAWDDFGLKDYGVTFSLAGQKAQTVSLGSAAPAHEKRQFTRLVSMETLQAQPDELLSYFIWADDVGPDGQVRRTASDMFYAEVRPFEEIFREGQSPPESDSEEQSGESGELTKLTELQKQVINATWRLQRENRVGLDDSPEADAKSTSKTKVAPTPNYVKDADVVLQSQREALKQAGEKKAQSENPRSKALWDTVEKEMQKAADELAKATKTPEPLPAALSSEQSAYQALLKLGSRERQVVQNRRSRSGQSGQQNQRQLDQLDLKQSENRYENQKQAASAKQDPQQREQLQVLNRLKELAQRQQDLNQRLKELQTALQEAESEREREEIRRSLKRLREEEQQMLADTDELLQRMQRPENQSRMAEARQQLEQTRNQVQRASEMIEKESVGQALSAGTRAQRELRELTDDLRKKNSAQFAEEMREMRMDARDLAQKEERIGEQLKSMTESKRKTLSDSGETKELLDQLARQREKMTNLLGDISRVSQDSEVSEPLLSKQLYDTLRKASQGNADQNIEKASELLKMSFANEAGQFEQKARAQIDEMKQGVERAAESVLGDETEALRLARNELDDLARQVQKELARAQTNAPNAGAQAGQSSQGQQNRTGDRANAQGEQDQSEQGSGAQPGSRDQQLAQAGQPQSQGDQQQGGQAPGQQASGENNQNNQNQQRAGGNGSQSGQEPNASSPQLSQTESQSGSEGAEQSSAQQGQQGRQRQGQPGAQRGNRPRQRASLTGQPGQDQPSGQQADAREGQGQNRNQNRAAAGGGGGDGGEVTDQGPITGEGYADWSDRLRDVEELLDLPELRGEVAGVRERARALRMDFKKLSKPPQWSVVRGQIAEPLLEVRNRVAEELARRESKDSLVPIDRDPVPRRFSELVRRYYEKLGSSENPPEASFE